MRRIVLCNRALLKSAHLARISPRTAQRGDLLTYNTDDGKSSYLLTKCFY